MNRPDYECNEHEGEGWEPPAGDVSVRDWLMDSHVCVYSHRHASNEGGDRD